MKCPCGNDKNYIECCGLYHQGQLPPTPEALMRSRYSAYVLANIDYIIATMRGKAAEGFDPIDAKNWANAVTWKKLTILEVTKIVNAKGTVTFLAQYTQNGKEHFILEKSFFIKQEEKWYYIDGIKPSIVRNEPCPCGCGKKFKQHLGMSTAS